MRYYYAQIDDLGKCVGVTDTDRQIESPQMIPVPSPDPGYIGRSHIDGVWQD